MRNFDLDTPLLQLDKNLYWTIRNAVEGVQIFGGIGSGKSSGSGRTLALNYLMAGFGGLVLTVKPDEVDVWKDYCNLTDREDDLLILEPNGEYFFNFLDYESTQNRTSITDNIVEVLKTVIRASEEKKGRSDDSFWETSLDMLLFNVIDLCILAYDRLSVQIIFDIVQTIPKSIESYREESKSAEKSSKAFFQALYLANKKLNQKVWDWHQSLDTDTKKDLKLKGTMAKEAEKAIPDARLYEMVLQFFEENFIPLSEKTRSIITFSFSGFLFRLLREPIYSMFCEHESNISPEDCLNGKIILINLPVKIYQKVGRDCQILFKYIFQRAMERRSIIDNNRPIFLWADEAQNFLHEHDAEYQATARSSRISTVYITQNLPNYFANMTGNNAEHRVKSFLGTLATKIFHANADIETNKYGSDLIGETYFVDVSKNTTVAKEVSVSRGVSDKLEKIIRPEKFIELMTGGPQNDFVTSAIVHIQGNFLKEKLNYIFIKLKQDGDPWQW